jgi:serine phosphatase RsbU (regulator of sigma subunit)/CHASE2 domain-containing sensor protein
VLVGLEPLPLAALRDATFDAYQRLMPRNRASQPAIIVEIDEASLDLKGQWPWPRTVVAELIRGISAARPAAIGVDLLFVEPDRSTVGADQILADAVQGKNVVLGIAGLERRDRRYPFPPQAAPVRIAGSRDLPLRKYDGHLQSRPEINKAAAGRGLLSADTSDRIVRRVPFVARIGQVIAPALSLEMLRVAAGEPAFRLEDRGAERVRLVVGDVSVPLQSDGTFYVYFGPHDPQRFVSAADVFSGKVAPELLSGKLVLIGVSGLGLLDYQATPLGERIPGVEVHAQILEQIFDGEYLRRPTGAAWIEALVLLIAGFAFILFVPAWRPRTAALLLGGALLVILGGALIAFQAGLLFNAAAPALGALLFFGATVAATLAEADRQRRLLREAQARVAGELEAARRIQMGLLPSPKERFAAEKRFSVAALLEPARSVGGDFYDCFMLDDDKLFFVVADVSGKGLASSLFMALSKALLKSIALRRGDDPAWILARASKEINRDNRESLFVTALAGVLDAKTGRLLVCNAGHEPAVVCRTDGAPERSSDPGGPPLCVIRDFTYESVVHQLGPGEWFCVITDGVTEAMDERGKLYGGARVLETLAALQSAPPDTVIAALNDDVRRFAGRAEQSDDITLLCVRWNGAAGAVGKAG